MAGNVSDAGSGAALDSDALLAAIVDSSFDAIVSKNLDSVITSWNGAAERLFGYSAEEAIGQSVLMLIPKNRRDEEVQIISKIRSGERVASYETVRRRKNGELIPVSLTISPVRNKAGEIVGASKIARDISAAKESDRRIRLLLREVNHRVKNQFAVILAMIREAGRRTLDPQTFEARIRDRITALAKSHDLLVGTDWSGTTLFDLAKTHFEAFAHTEQISLSGPMLTLEPSVVQYLGMAFHELSTNSAKYGALSQRGGLVAIAWRLSGSEDPALILEWEEWSVPRGKETPTATRKGFGSVVLEQIAPNAVSGSASIERSAGYLLWRLEAPLKSFVRSGAFEHDVLNGPAPGVG